MALVAEFNLHCYALIYIQDEQSRTHTYSGGRAGTFQIEFRKKCTGETPTVIAGDFHKFVKGQTKESCKQFQPRRNQALIAMKNPVRRNSKKRAENWRRKTELCKCSENADTQKHQKTQTMRECPHPKLGHKDNTGSEFLPLSKALGLYSEVSKLI